MTLIDPVKLEKMVLAKRIGQFLSLDHSPEERAAVEEVARKLAGDTSVQVREVLAFEVRKCDQLSEDLIRTIAMDEEEVAAPFLAMTRALSDEKLAALIALIPEYGRVPLAKRADLKAEAVAALVSYGGEDSLTYLVRNDNLRLSSEVAQHLVKRFGDNRLLMDQLSARSDLPQSVVEILVDKISDHYRQTLIKNYAIESATGERAGNSHRFDALWKKVEHATSEQVHAFVVDMRAKKQLTAMLATEMAERGCLYFLESCVALEAGMTLEQVRDTFSLENPNEFVRLMQMAGISKAMAPRLLKLIKGRYAKGLDGSYALKLTDDSDED